MAQLLADVTLFPQTLINVRLQPGQDWKANTRCPPKPRPWKPNWATPAAC